MLTRWQYAHVALPQRRGKGSISAGMNTDDILTFPLTKISATPVDSPLITLTGEYRCYQWLTADVRSRQCCHHRTGNKRDIRTATPSSHRLIRPLPPNAT